MVLQKTVWAGSNLNGYPQGAQALRELAGVKLSAKQVQRITSQIGADRVQERRDLVEEHRRRPLMERVTAAPRVKPAGLAVVMMDGGRFQRRDHFRERAAAGTPPKQKSPSDDKQTHWREDKVGLVLSMDSETHSQDPAPEFPDWLASAPVVAELAQLAEREDSSAPTSSAEPGPDEGESREPLGDWKNLAPKLLSREVIASSAEADEFGWHLQWKAWTLSVPAAPRQAFVADGLAVNWTIHKKHFSQMTGILDLMHALSYAWGAAMVLPEGSQAYRRYATWIWKGQVRLVIAELQTHQERLGLPPAEASPGDPRTRIARALTYYENHQLRMNYPAYRREGLPLTSSHVESTIKQINARVKGTEKFWRQDHGEAVLQLRADALSDSQPLDSFWLRWQKSQTGTNHYRKLQVA